MGFLFECKKIFRKKYVIVSVVIFLLINLYKINLDFHQYGRYDNDFNRAWWEVYYQVDGTMTPDKINFVVQEYQKATDIVNRGNYNTDSKQEGTYTGYIYGDMNMFREHYEAMEYAYHYPDSLQRVKEKAEENIRLFTEKGNRKLVRENQNILKLYGNRVIPAYYDTLGFERYFEYDFSSLLILMLLLLALIPMFSRERETHMDQLLFSSKYGKSAVIFWKLCASLFYIFLISALFLAEDLLAFSCTYHLYGWMNPLFAIRSFSMTPYLFTIGQYVIVNIAAKILSFLVLGSFLLLLSSVFGDSLLPFCAGTALFGILILWNDFLSGENGGTVLFNPIALIVNRNMLQSYQTVSLFGVPVLLLSLSIAFFVLLFLLEIVLVVWLNLKHLGFKKSFRRFLKRKGEEVVSA